MIVIDCSAVVDALTAVAGSEALRSRIAVEDLHAPSLLDYEVVSAVRGLVLRGQLTASRAAECLSDFADLPVQRWSSADALRRRTFQLRNTLSAYDAAYVALAEALDCPLVTRDGRLARSAEHAALIEVL